jgi:nucleotide-binding universal stress UspA family protein
MENVKRILVVSRSTEGCQKAVHVGASLAQKYGAKLFVVHVKHSPFRLAGWNVGIPSLQREYDRLQQTFRKEIDHILKAEEAQGLAVKSVMREGEPVDEILQLVDEENIDLLIMLAHAYGAAFDNPELLVACVVGDGEAETGPLATSWHSNKFLNPVNDGAVLPILHLNGYKIAGLPPLPGLPRFQRPV